MADVLPYWGLLAAFSGFMALRHRDRVSRGEARSDDPPLWFMLFIFLAVPLFFIVFGEGGTVEGVTDPSEVGIPGR